MIPNNKLFKFMKDNLHLKKYKIEELPTDLVEEIRRTFQIFDVDNGKIFIYGHIRVFTLNRRRVNFDIDGPNGIPEISEF